MIPFQFLLVSPVLAVLFTITGGKPYYLAGLLPLLIAAGSPSVDRWLDRGRAGFVLNMNEDVGETIGWPAFTEQVSDVSREQPAGAIILTSNYGEAGAIDRFGPGLPRAYSGYHAYHDWGARPVAAARSSSSGRRTDHRLLRPAKALVTDLARAPQPRLTLLLRGQRPRVPDAAGHPRLELVLPVRTLHGRTGDL